MRALPIGTMVEVYRTKIVSEIMVVECEAPLILRPAMIYERFQCWFRQRRAKANEIVAAAEAARFIESVKERV